MARKQWEILDRWSWNLSDVTRENVAAWVQDRKRSFPGCQVRTFRRHVRAGGAAVQLVVGVVRRPEADPDPSRSYGAERPGAI